jgi:hypothetical protein
MCLDWRSQSQDQWTEAQWRQLGEVLAKAEPLLAQIRVLFVQEGPIWPLETDSTFESGGKSWAALREFTRLFWFSTLFQAHTGAHDAAFDDVIAAFRTGDLLENEPIMFSHLTRFACHDMARNAFLQTFAPGVLNAGQIDRLSSYAATQLNRSIFAEALEVEAYQTAQSIDAPSHVHGNVFLYNTPGIEGLFWRLYSTPLAKPLYNRDEFAFATFLQKMAAASHQPFYEGYRQLSTSYERLDETWFIPLARSAANGMLPLLDAQAKNEASSSIMAIGLRLEQCQAETGRVPNTLDAVAHYFDGHVPVDPFSGEALRYVPGQDGFRLYSVGSNLKDDGGKEDARADIVWRNKAGF